MYAVSEFEERTTRRRGRFERWVLRKIFRTLLSFGTSRVVSDIDDLQPSSAVDAIRIRLPTLSQTLRILAKRDIMLGQTYVDGHWSVQSEKLYDFLYLIDPKEGSRLQKWFVVSNRFHVFRDAFKQLFSDSFHESCGGALQQRPSTCFANFGAVAILYVRFLRTK